MTDAMTTANIAVVRDFLEALAVPDSDRALALLSPDVEWRNTGLPTFRGKRVFAMVRDMERRGLGFGVDIHAIAAGEDGRVLTDRTDHLWKGPVKTGFWVRGTFTVRDGLITVWDDAFSLTNLLLGFLRR
ncbi:MAG: nuclear transport factor 2 family protein [Propionibacteriales bacterium]|nr:nuclear transport factor 2 family protein [Propionibacteriales bacterium]